MSTKQKPIAKKKNWLAVRGRYTWHLKSPVNKWFEQSHWWSSGENKEPEAALYELARRHPLVNETPPEITIPLPGTKLSPLPFCLQPKPFLRLTQQLGLKSWPNLTASEKREWKSSIGKMKSFDSRSIESVSIDITRQADLLISKKRSEAREAEKNTKGYYCRMLPWYGGPTDQEWKDAISQCAVEAHRRGYVLIAIEPNLTADKAEAVMTKQYREHNSLYPYPQSNQRARWHQWLPIISDFEKMNNSGKWDSQIFVRYRRVLDGIQFC